MRWENSVYFEGEDREMRKQKLISTILIGMVCMGGLSYTFAEESATKSSQRPTMKAEGKGGLAQLINQFIGKVNQTANTVELKTASIYADTPYDIYTYWYYQEVFQEENAHIRIKNDTRRYEEDWAESWIKELKEGDGPDVICFTPAIRGEKLFEVQEIVSIEEIRKLYPSYASNISKAALEARTYVDGKQYVVPTQGFYEGVFVNEDLFKEYGVELPTDWEKFEAAIEAFGDTEITPVAAALNHVPHYWIENIVLAEGGRKNHSNRNITQVKDTWVIALDRLHRLGEKGAFPDDMATMTHEDAIGMFHDKEAAMIVEGNWAIGAFEMQEDMKFLLMPASNSEKNKGKQVVGDFVGTYGITRKAWDDPSKREAAVKYVTYMTGNEALIDTFYTFGGGLVPAKLGVLEEVSELRQQSLDVVSVVDKISPPADEWLSKKGYSYLVKQIPAIVEGSITSEEVMNQVIQYQKQKENALNK